ncbi:MAG: hypothetical protein BWY28_02790 [bacterium ADurb.Bin236]|nr:MAG: hypothetical protein BWY28_02790 [bacterium ADurb.Bin236]
MRQAATAVRVVPPGSQPTSAWMKSTSLRAPSPFAIMVDVRMKRGIASRAVRSEIENICWAAIASP